jgi:hypothetical protein
MKKLLKYALPAIIAGILVGSSVGAQVAPANFWKLVNGALQPINSAWTLAVKIFDKGGVVYDVRAFGAKCDGATDDTTALQNTLNSVNGGTMQLPVGNCISNPLTVHSFEHVKGQGASSTITLKNSATGDGNLFETTSTNGLQDFSLENFAINANASNETTGTAAVYVTGNNKILKNIKISYLTVSNCYVHCIFLTGDQTSTHYSVAIDHNTIANFGVGTVGYGIYTDYVPSADIAVNTLSQNNGDDAIEIGHLGANVHNNYLASGPIQFPFGSNSIIANNTIANGNLQNDANEADNVTITGNQILNATPATGYAGISAFGNGDIIMNNYVKVASTSATSTVSGIRTYHGNNDTISYNYVDMTASSSINNCYYPESSTAITITGNQGTNCGVGLELVWDNNTASYNIFTNTTVGIDLASSTVSGHVMSGNQLSYNNLSAATTPFRMNNQTGFGTFINATSIISTAFPQMTVQYPGTTACSFGETVNGFYVFQTCQYAFGTATPNTKVDIAGSLGAAATVSAASSTLTKASNSFEVFSGSTTGTISLPQISTSQDQIISIKNRGTANLLIVPTSTDFIWLVASNASATTYTLSSGSSTGLQNDGTYWDQLWR